jgi:hypothetical protein
LEDFILDCEDFRGRYYLCGNFVVRDIQDFKFRILIVRTGLNLNNFGGPSY